MGNDNWQFDIIASQINDVYMQSSFMMMAKTNFKDQLGDVYSTDPIGDNDWINSHSADIDS